MKVKLKIKIKSKYYTYETASIVHRAELKSENKSLGYLLNKAAAFKPAFGN